MSQSTNPEGSNQSRVEVDAASLERLVKAAVERALDKQLSAIETRLQSKMEQLSVQSTQEILAAVRGTTGANVASASSASIAAPSSPSQASLPLSQRRNMPSLVANTGSRMGKNTKSSAELLSPISSPKWASGDGITVEFQVEDPTKTISGPVSRPAKLPPLSITTGVKSSTSDNKARSYLVEYLHYITHHELHSFPFKLSTTINESMILIY